jgi:excisionase family DNA binding protein
MRDSLSARLERSRLRSDRIESLPFLLTVSEAATVLAVAPCTVRAMVAAGSLPSVRVGRAVRIPEAAVRAIASPRAKGGER